MTQHQAIPWKRIAVQATAIVISILLAFAIEAWWAERQERELEHRTLEALRSDLEATNEELDRLLRGVAAARENFSRFQSASPAELVEFDPEEVRLTMVSLVTPASFNPITATHDALSNDGRLGLISDPELLRHLSNFQGALDDIEAKFFSADQMLLVRRFVSQRGGGLMMLGGQDCFVGGGYNKTPIGELLPVYLNREVAYEDSEEGHRWTLTREGWLQDWTRLRATEIAERKQLAELPGFRVVNRVDGLKPGASLLAAVMADEDEPLPALVTQRFGKGRTAAQLVGDLYKWQMHQKDHKQRDLQQLWRQVVRWLVADVPQRVKVTSDQRRNAVGPRTIEVAVNDHEYKPHDNAEVQVIVTTPNAEKIELTAEASSREPGLYEVDFWPRDDGPYRARAEVTSADGEELEPKETGWTTEPGADEFRRLNTDRSLLEQIAQHSGGELIEATALDEFVAGLPNRKVPVTETWVYPIWHQPWVLGLAICCLCCEWGLRRWKGLP